MMKKNNFTFAVAVRGTELEQGFIKKSLTSAIKLNPGEFLVGIDNPSPVGLYDKIEKVFKDNDYKNYKIIKVDKTDDWGFQLAHNIWEMYNLSKHDRILSFDIDSTLREEVLLGLKDIGKNNVAVLSFTKKLRMKTFTEVLRFVSYRLRVRQTKNPFSGIYWVHIPSFFKLVNLDDYKKIKNGIDSYLQVVLGKQDELKMMCRKEMGCGCLDIQNEDYPWRQFQTGIWLNANKSLPPTISAHFPQDKFKFKKNMVKQGVTNPRSTVKGIMIRLSKGMLTPAFFLLVKATIYGHGDMVKGYLWAKKNSDSEAVKVASGMGYNEWSMLGAKYIDPIKNWKRHGTGY